MLKRDIFVFGSNLAGRHGKGAAKYALEHHGAEYGNGQGLQGNSYAIPTKDIYLNTLCLSNIKRYVDQFIAFAEENPQFDFHMTAIGTGLAGYAVEDIAPMFVKIPDNIFLPDEFDEYLYELRENSLDFTVWDLMADY